MWGHGRLGPNCREMQQLPICLSGGGANHPTNGRRLWGRMISCGSIGNRPAWRLPTATQLTNLPHTERRYNKFSRESTGHFHHLRGHGRVRQNHADAAAGGAAARDGANGARDGRAGRHAHRRQDPPHSARFRQPGAEPHRRAAALFRLAGAECGPVDSAGARAAAKSCWPTGSRIPRWSTRAAGAAWARRT